MSSILLNKQNNSTITSNNNKLTLRLSNGVELKNLEVCLSSLTIFYSWNNVTSAFANKTLSYTWHDSTVNYITIPDGFYTVSDLNQYIQFVMYNNGHYLVDTNGDNYYFITLEENPVYYGVTLTCTMIPTSLPSGYTNPASMGFPVTASVTLLTIPAYTTDSRGLTYGFGKLIGFTAGTYPSVSQITTYTVNSSVTPVIHPVTNVYVKCNLVDNSKFNIQDNVIKVFTPQVTVGSQIVIEPYQYTYYSVLPKIYDEINISFFDQNFSPLAILDDNIQVELQLKEKK